jgi:hypothetical protein
MSRSWIGGQLGPRIGQSPRSAVQDATAATTTKTQIVSAQQTSATQPVTVGASFVATSALSAKPKARLKVGATLAGASVESAKGKGRAKALASLPLSSFLSVKVKSRTRIKASYILTSTASAKGKGRGKARATLTSASLVSASFKTNSAPVTVGISLVATSALSAKGKGRTKVGATLAGASVESAKGKGRAKSLAATLPTLTLLSAKGKGRSKALRPLPLSAAILSASGKGRASGHGAPLAAVSALSASVLQAVHQPVTVGATLTAASVLSGQFQGRIAVMPTYSGGTVLSLPSLPQRAWAFASLSATSGLQARARGAAKASAQVVSLAEFSARAKGAARTGVVGFQAGSALSATATGAYSDDEEALMLLLGSM